MGSLVQEKRSLHVLLANLHVNLDIERSIFVCQIYFNCTMRLQLLLRVSQNFSKKFERYPLLIIDEWLIDELSRQQEHFLFELVERRHTDKSTILCTQYRIEDWHARLGEGILADAIIDRIVNNSIHIYAGELNMRKVKNTP